MRRDLTNFKAGRGDQFKEGFNWLYGDCAGALGAGGPVWGVTLPPPAERPRGEFRCRAEGGAYPR